MGRAFHTFICKPTTQLIAVATLLTTALIVGCATGDHDTERNPTSFDMPTPESNAHPAAYLTERFPVNRPLPKHDTSEVEFFFKKCSAGSGKWPKSATEYDCSYP